MILRYFNPRDPQLLAPYWVFRVTNCNNYRDSLRAGRSGIESRWRRDFPHTSRLNLGPTHPPIQWVPGLSRGQSGRGVAFNIHSHLATRSKKEQRYTCTHVLTFWVFVACSGVNFTFIFTFTLKAFNVSKMKVGSRKLSPCGQQMARCQLRRHVTFTFKLPVCNL